MENQNIYPFSKIIGKVSVPSSNSLISKTGWNSLSSISSLIGRLLVQIMIARLLGPDGMGRIAYLIWLIEIVNLATNFGLSSSLTRFLADLHGRDQTSQAINFASWIYIRFIGMSVVGTMMIGIIFPVLPRFHQDHSELPILMMLFLAFGMQSINQSNLAGNQRFDILARINITSTITLVLGILVGGYFLGETGVLIGYLIGSLYPAACSLSMLRSPWTGIALEPSLRRRIVKFSFYTWISMLVSAFVWSRMEIFFLERYWNIHEVATFTIGLTFVALIQQVASLFSGALLAHFSGMVGEGNKLRMQRHYSMTIKLLAIVVFPLSLFCAATVPLMLPLIFGAAYSYAIPTTMLLTASSVLAFSTVVSSLLYAHEDSRFIAVSGALAAVLAISSGISVIAEYGIGGAIWTRFLLQSGLFFNGVIYLKRKRGYDTPYTDLIPALFSAAVSATLIWSIVDLWRRPESILVAIPAGVVLYAAFLKYFSLIQATEARTLELMSSKLWSPVARPLTKTIRWIANT